MLRTGYLGLVAAAILFSACGGEIESVYVGVDREGPAPELGGDVPAEPLEPMAEEDPTCPAAAAVLSTRNGWAGAKAAEPAYDTLDFELMVRPEAGNIDALVAVANQDVTDFSDAAILVRFAEDGLIDARDGSGYSHDVPVAYEAGAWYSIVISADVTNRTYDVEVGRCGETPKALITDAAFRSDAPTSDQLTTWAAWSSQSATLDVATPSWVAAGSCSPSTCESLGLQCGTLSDGCGGTLSCGVCQGDQECVVGGICSAPTVPPPAPEPSPQPEPEPSPPPPSPLPPDPGPGGDRPWAHNTGPKDLAALVPSGDIDVTTDGAVIENVDVTGNINIDADNVTVRNFRINANGAFYGIQVRSGVQGVLIEDGEIMNSDSAGVFGQGSATYRRLHIHDHNKDGMKIRGAGSLVEYCFVTRLGTGEGSHADANQTRSGGPVTFRYNNFYIPKPGTPAHDALPLPPGVTEFRSNATHIIHDGTTGILIERNWLTGGNYTIYGNPGTTVRNNIFGRENGDHPSLSTCVNCDGSSRLCNGPFDDWSGNVWEDDGTEAGNNITCD